MRRDFTDPFVRFDTRDRRRSHQGHGVSGVVVRRGPPLDDHLRSFLRYRAGEHSLATRRALLSGGEGDRILSLYHNELGGEPAHRRDVPLAHGPDHRSWGLRVLRRTVPFGMDLLFVLFPGDRGFDAGGGTAGV